MKPSSQKAPLCSTSHHPFSVHAYWPLAEFRRFDALSSNAQAAQEAKVRLLNLFLKRCQEHVAIHDMKKIVSSPLGSVSQIDGSLRGSGVVRDRVSDENKVWITIPFRHEWAHAGIASLLYKASESLRLLDPDVPNYKFGVSWSLASQHMVHVVRPK